MMEVENSYQSNLLAHRKFHTPQLRGGWKRLRSERQRALGERYIVSDGKRVLAVWVAPINKWVATHFSLLALTETLQIDMSGQPILLLTGNIGINDVAKRGIAALARAKMGI
jgi:hypothetical protein